jgi:hypothetical protein
MTDAYSGSIELGETDEVIIESVSIDDLDTERWTADLPPDAINAGTQIIGEMLVRLLDGARADQTATGRLEVSEAGERTLTGVTRFSSP